MKSLAIVRVLVVFAVLALVTSASPESLSAQTPVKGVSTATSISGQTKYTDPIWKPVESKSATNPFAILLPALNRSFFDLFSW